MGELERRLKAAGIGVWSQGVVCRVSDEPMRRFVPGFADVLVGGEAA